MGRKSLWGIAKGDRQPHLIKRRTRGPFAGRQLYELTNQPNDGSGCSNRRGWRVKGRVVRSRFPGVWRPIRSMACPVREPN